MKKVLVFALAAVLSLGFATTVAAAQPWAPAQGWCWGQDGTGFRGGCGGFYADGTWACPFRDQWGGFLSRDEVVWNLDVMLADGLITQAQRDFYLESFDLGQVPGLGFGGGRCGGGGRGGFAGGRGAGMRW